MKWKFGFVLILIRCFGWVKISIDLDGEWFFGKSWVGNVGMVWFCYGWFMCVGSVFVWL